MGGDATFSGTTYQANVIAYVAVHVITDTKLRWLPILDDTPVAIAGEVKGPGDDARLEFASSAPIEVQVKHGLKGYKTTEEIITTVRDASTASDKSVVVLAVDSSASPSIRVDLRKDSTDCAQGELMACRKSLKRLSTSWARASLRLCAEFA